MKTLDLAIQCGDFSYSFFFFQQCGMSGIGSGSKVAGSNLGRKNSLPVDQSPVSSPIF